MSEIPPIPSRPEKADEEQLRLFALETSFVEAAKEIRLGEKIKATCDSDPFNRWLEEVHNTELVESMKKTLKRNYTKEVFSSLCKAVTAVIMGKGEQLISYPEPYVEGEREYGIDVQFVSANRLTEKHKLDGVILEFNKAIGNI